MTVWKNFSELSVLSVLVVLFNVIINLSQDDNIVLVVRFLNRRDAEHLKFCHPDEGQDLKKRSRNKFGMTVWKNLSELSVLNVLVV
jgi:hypothetical protein